VPDAMRITRSRASIRALAAALVIGLAASAPAARAEALLLGAPHPSAEQIVQKNAAARGGVEAWQKIKAMAWTGRIESANPQRPTMPFLLEQQRPNKIRFEVIMDQQKSVRIFDGMQGWKLRPSASGRPELTTYSTDETSYARDAQVIDGPLMDFAARGYPLKLEAVDDIDGRKAFRLMARLPSGETQRVWVDADTFIDLRQDRTSKDRMGRPFTVSVYFRNYQTFEGLQIPLAIETRTAGSDLVDRIVIERIALNPTLDDRQFAKPRPPGSHRNGIIVDTRSATEGAVTTGRPVP
jgi:hypothetical protein